MTSFNCVSLFISSICPASDCPWYVSLSPLSNLPGLRGVVADATEYDTQTHTHKVVGVNNTWGLLHSRASIWDLHKSRSSFSDAEPCVLTESCTSSVMFLMHRGKKEKKPKMWWISLERRNLDSERSRKWHTCSYFWLCTLTGDVWSTVLPDLLVSGPVWGFWINFYIFYFHSWMMNKHLGRFEIFLLFKGDLCWMVRRLDPDADIHKRKPDWLK